MTPHVKYLNAGYELRTSINRGHGLVGFLKKGLGRNVVLRADVDAIRILGLSSLPCASESPWKT